MSDAYWGNVVLAMPMDDSPVSCLKGNVITAWYGCARSSATYAPITGNAYSCRFDGTDDYLTTPNTGQFNFGSGAFTIDGWIRRNAVSPDHIVLSSYNGGSGTYAGWYIKLGASGVVEFYSIDNSLAGHSVTSSTSALPSFAWHYLEVNSDGTTVRIFVDGALVGSGSATAIRNASEDLFIGLLSNLYILPLNGNLDDLRITKGVCRHTAAYTAPTVPFETTGPVIAEVITVPLAVTVFAPPVVISVPIEVTVGGTLLSVSLAITVVASTSAPFTTSCGLAVTVLPAGYLTGVQSVGIGTSGLAAVWIPVVQMNGSDISAQVVGDILVEASEGAARIAELTLRPPAATTFAVSAWCGARITIDVADNSTGTPRYATRLFTGVVDVPTINLATRTIALRCTDDLQGIVEAMSNAALLALIGGYESPAVFSPTAIGWPYAQDRLSTVPSALDISPEGAVRVTPWAAKSVADLDLDQTLVLENTIAVQIADRSGLVNEIQVEFDYRFPRLKSETHALSFTAVDMSGFAAYVLAGSFFLQRDQVKSAISAAGGTIETITYEPLPNSIIAVGAGYWSPGPYDSTLCMGFAASVSFDHSQKIEEQHRIVVSNALSVAAVGQRRETLHGALEGVYPDLLAVETSILLHKKEISGVPPPDVAVSLEGKTNTAETTLTPETDRAAANAAMIALIAVAKTRILASHRRSAVSASVPLIPAIDVDKTLHVTADGVDAKGKCASVTHRLSTDNGAALTEFSLAICSLAGVGVTHASTPTAAPTGTTVAATPIATASTVVFNSGVAEDHKITVTFPAVADAQRNNAQIVMDTPVAAPINEDLFTVTL